jgi:hypothetical protein
VGGIPPGQYEAFAVIVRGAWNQATEGEFSPAWPLGPVQVTLGERNTLEGRLPESATLNLRLASDLRPSTGPWGSWIWQATCPRRDQAPHVTITALDGVPLSACNGTLSATAWISNPEVAAGEVSIVLSRARYKLSFEHPGFEPVETVVRCDGGGASTAELLLKPVTSEPRPR